MGTIDVQEPEVKDLKQAGRPAAAILPKLIVRTGTSDNRGSGRLLPPQPPSF